MVRKKRLLAAAVAVVAVLIWKPVLATDPAVCTSAKAVTSVTDECLSCSKGRNREHREKSLRQLANEGYTLVEVVKTKDGVFIYYFEKD